MPIKKLIFDKLHYMALALVLIVSVVFSYTYPLNIAAYDNSNYLSMILENKSNLIHASGYPAIISMVIAILGILQPVSVVDVDWLNKIQEIHLTLHLLLFSVSFFVCSHTFGKRSAIIICIMWGLNPITLTGVNASAPEWLQGDLIVLAFLIAAQNFVNQKSAPKIPLYALAFGIMFCAYLVKFNTMVIFPVLVLIVLLERKNVIWKLKTLVVCVFACWVLLYSFVKIYHQPTTHAKQLSYDHAWVLMEVMPTDYFQANVDQLGINSLRWKVLRVVVPTDTSMAGAYCCIDSGAPPEIREQYFAKYQKIMGMSREQLLAFIALNPLPPNVPNFAMAVPLYWYVGLPVIDKLGIAVFKESFVQNPVFYIKKVISGFLKWRTYDQSFITVPSSENTLGLIFQDEAGKSNTQFQYYKISKNTIAQHALYWNPVERLWSPGVTLFQWVFKFIGSRWCEFIILSLAFIGLAVTKVEKFRLLGFISMLGVLIFASTSYMLLGLRNKEAISIIPLLSIFIATGITSVISYANAFVVSKYASNIRHG
jgi:hypothetical protein